MRIAIDIRPMLERRRAGVSLYTANLVRTLVGRGAHEYALFCNAFGKRVPDDVPAESNRVFHRFTRYPNKLLNAAFAFTGRPYIEDLVGPADGIYLPNLNFAATRMPYAVTVHDLSFIRYRRFFSLRQRAWHAAVRPARLILGASRVIAVSDHTRRDIMEMFGLPEDRIAVVHPAAGPEFSAASGDDIAAVRRKHGLDSPFLLYLGTLEPRKNVARLIEAYGAASVDADLVIAGGAGWLHKEIFESAGRSPKKDRIRFLGYVDDADKPGLYSAAEAFLYPSHYEGFGMPPLEAMACGTPVVASHASSLPEVVGDAGLLVDPYDVTEIAGAIEAVMTDGPLRERFRREGPRRAAAFTWDRSAERLERVLTEMAERTKRA